MSKGGGNICVMRSRSKILLLAFLLFSGLHSFAQFKDEAAMKKEAANAFEEEDYARGYKLYSTLVANYPKDPEYNYRLGVCAMFAEADKKKPINYLQLASKSEDVEKEVFFYLGKAFHLNFRFDEAMKFYNQFKQVGSSSMQKKLQVDREIQCCKNAKRLLANLQELVVLDKKTVNRADYYRSYDLKDIGGKLLVKPQEFTSAADKKKKDNSIIFLPASKEVLYYATYGEKGDNKDIYVVKRMPDGNWGKPEPVPGINTEYDEDYPFLHPNGKVLYFASKGHNSMGGYDIFKSQLDPSSGRWQTPVNLDFPINTPSDDYLFVTDSLEKIAYLASTRQSSSGKTDIYKILTERRPAEYAVIKGSVLKKQPNQSVQAKIKVKNIDTGEDEGTFTAEENGEYNIKISNGGKFIFTVETPGFPTQSQGVNVPVAFNYKPYRQAIEYDGQKLIITNFFETNDNDENNYLQYLQLIEEKAKMEVNSGDFDLNATANNNAANNNVISKNNTAPDTTQKTATTTTATTTGKNNVSNKQLIDMAYADAKELQQEAGELKKDASTAFSAANSKQDQANDKKEELAETQLKANNETDPAKKQELNSQVEKLKEEAELYDLQAKTANNIAKQLEVDASNKQKEADLNSQYAKALEEADKTKNNKDAIAKLESLQKQIEDLSKQKSQSNALVESIKADAQNKEQELQNAENKQQKLEREENDIKTQIADLDQQIEKTKDKTLVENLKAQKEELQSDLSDKQKETQTNLTKIGNLKDEADVLKSQAEYASSVASGNIPVNTNSSGSNTTGTNSTATTNTVNTTVASTNTNTTANTTTVAATNSNTIGATNTNTVVNTNTVAATNSNTVAATNTVATTSTVVATNNTTTTNTIAATTTNTSVTTNTVSETNTVTANPFEERSKKYDTDLVALTNAGNNLDNNKKKQELLKEYVKATDEAIKEKKLEIGKTKDAAEKTALNNEVKLLTDKKTELLKEEKLVNIQVKEQEKQAALAAKSPAQDSIKKAQTLLANATNADTAQTKILNDIDDPRIQSVNSLIAQTEKDYQEEKKVFSAIEYNNGKALEIKYNADNKLSEHYKNNTLLEQQLEQLKADMAKENAANNDKKILELNQQADALSAQALKLRKEAKTMTGSDKQNALTKILALEKQAAGLRYQAARLQYQSDDDNYKTNQQAIEQLTAQNTNGSLEADQVKQLITESEKMKKEAYSLREEAEAQGEVEAKIGALSNADEKEKEALQKQETVLALLKKMNPKATVAASASKEKQLEDLKSKLDKETQNSVAALRLLSDANKTEYNALINSITAAEKSGAQNKEEAAQYKTKGLELYKQATDELNKIGVAKDDRQKRELLIEVNRKMEESITQLRNAKQLLEGGQIASSTATETVTPSNNNSVTTTSTVATNTIAATNTVTTENTTNTTSVTPTETVSANNTANTNTVTPVNSNTLTAGNTTGTVTTTNTVNPVNTSTVTSSNNTDAVTAVNTNTTSAVNTNTTTTNTPTVSPSENNPVTANLTEQKKEEIKRSPEYIKYNALNNEVIKLDKAAAKDETTAKDLTAQYERTLQEANSLPEGEAKNQKLKEAERTKTKSDSLTQVASDTRSLARVKQQESDSYLQNLDKTTADNIALVVKAEANPAAENTAGNTPSKYQGYSEPFRAKANQNDSKLADLKASGNNNNDNLKEQNQVITQYVKDIDKEIATLRTQQTASANATEKNKIAQKIQNLQTRKKELNADKTANDNTIRLASANTNTTTVASTNTTTTSSNTVTASNTNTSATETNTVATVNGNSTNNSSATSGNGFEIRNSNAYSATNPIPVNEKLPDGLVFRVQIGAFKTPIPPDRFAGLAPIGAESTNFGFIRYQVGMFNDYQRANAVKNDLRKLKYNDAFVVAYRNGKRITLAEALDSLARSGADVSSNANSTAGITNNSNIPLNPEAKNNAGVIPVTSSGDLNTFNGVFYTVQIGVYSNNVNAEALRNLKPVYRESMPTGNYRYTAGIYNDFDKVRADQTKVVSLGIKDAFVSGYLNGKRIKVNEPIVDVAGAQFLPENPIQFPGNNSTASTSTATPSNASSATTNTVQPFTNNVTEGPAPTSENGVKVGEEGITFKVQIGAYSKQVPVEVVNTWLKIKSWPIKNTLVNGLYIYNVGSFVDAKFAKTLRDEVKSLGMTDAYVVVYKDGVKLSGAEAAQYLNR